MSNSCYSIWIHSNQLLFAKALKVSFSEPNLKIMNELLLRDMNDLNLLNKDVIDQHDIGYCSMASIVSNGDSSMFSVESEETCSSRFSYNNCDYTYEPKNTITKEKNNHEETHQIHTELESENILFLKDNKKEDLPQNYCKNDCINDLCYNENYEKSVNKLGLS